MNKLNRINKIARLTVRAGANSRGLVMNHNTRALKVRTGR